MRKRQAGRRKNVPLDGVANLLWYILHDCAVGVVILHLGRSKALHIPTVNCLIEAAGENPAQQRKDHQHHAQNGNAKSRHPAVEPNELSQKVRQAVDDSFDRIRHGTQSAVLLPDSA